jgi:hypothetical protein
MAMSSWIYLIWAPHAIAKNPTQEIPKIKMSRAQLANYASCKEQALKELKNQPKKLGFVLASCRDMFPASALFLDCKKKVFSKFRKEPEKFKEAVSRCQEELLARSFDPRREIPFHFSKQNVFFSGMGLNLPKRVQTLTSEKGNHSCAPLEEALQDPTKREFIGLGNDPKVFKGVPAEAKSSVIRKTFGGGPVRRGEFSTAKTGRDTLFFPTSYCYMNRAMGEIYTGVKTYYLIAPGNKLATPYFGVAFYNPKYESDPTKFAQSVLASLDPEYKILITKPGFFYIGKKEIGDLDEDGDPRNVCEEPRTEDFMIIIKHDGKRPTYLSLINVGNLCAFGDRMATRLFQKNASAGETAEPETNSATESAEDPTENTPMEPEEAPSPDESLEGESGQAP